MFEFHNNNNSIAFEWELSIAITSWDKMFKKLSLSEPKLL